MTKTLADLAAKKNILRLINEKPGLTTDEIAEKTGLPEDKVISLLSGLRKISCRPRSHALGDVLRAEYWPTRAQN